MEDKKPKYTEIFRGQIILGLTSEGYSPLSLLDVDTFKVGEPFASEFPKNSNVSIWYLISDKPIPEKEINMELVKYQNGISDSDYGAHYSDMTGYLWTDEEAKVGGHDLIRELQSNLGKFLHMEVKVF